MPQQHILIHLADLPAAALQELDRRVEQQRLIYFAQPVPRFTLTREQQRQAALVLQRAGRAAYLHYKAKCRIEWTAGRVRRRQPTRTSVILQLLTLHLNNGKTGNSKVKKTAGARRVAVVRPKQPAAAAQQPVPVAAVAQGNAT